LKQDKILAHEANAFTEWGRLDVDQIRVLEVATINREYGQIPDIPAHLLFSYITMFLV